MIDRSAQLEIRRTLRGLLWVSPWIVGFLAFLALPMGLSLYYSMTDYSILERPLWVGLENYRALWDDPTFWKVMRNTVVYALLSIPLGTATALGLALLLNHDVRGIGVFRTAVFLPTFVPLVAAAMVWMWLFNGEYGLINRLLAMVGVTGPAWLVDQQWVMPAMIIMSLWGVGQAVVIYLAALQDVPKQLYEAARIDGMGPARQFVNITLPMISPAILFSVIALTIANVQVFAVPYVMFRRPDGQNPAGHFYTMYLYENAFVYGQMGYASAMAWVQLLVVLALTGVMLVVSRRLVHYRRV